MATAFYIGNAQTIAEVSTCTVTAVAAGGTLTATINGKQVTYTCQAADTVLTAVAAWLVLLRTSGVPTEFAQITWTAPTNTIFATSATQGTPWYGGPGGISGGLTFAAAGGAALVQGLGTANGSPSDVANPKNWLRNGFNAIPQAGDDVVLQNLAAVPWLWNLDYYSGVAFASVTHWRSFTGVIGLPEINPAGYREFRPRTFQLGNATGGISSSAAAATTLALTIGVGSGGGSPSENYNVGYQQTTLNLLAGGAVRFIGYHGQNSVTVQSGNLFIGNNPGETSNLNNATVDGAGSLTLGVGVIMGGTLTVNNGTATVSCAVPTIIANAGSSVTVQGDSLTYPNIIGTNNSNFIWLSGSSITNLTLTTGARLNKTQDIRPMSIVNFMIDGDTCQVLDPNSKITWMNNVGIVKNQVNAGPFPFLGPRTVKIV